MITNPFLMGIWDEIEEKRRERKRQQLLLASRNPVSPSSSQHLALSGVRTAQSRGAVQRARPPTQVPSYEGEGGPRGGKQKEQWVCRVLNKMQYNNTELSARCLNNRRVKAQGHPSLSGDRPWWVSVAIRQDATAHVLSLFRWIYFIKKKKFVKIKNIYLDFFEIHRLPN